MALYNPSKANREREAREKYEELKKHLSTLDADSKVHQYWLALEHMYDMEATIKEQQEKLDKYKQFFALLDDLTPRRLSLYHPIA